mmetsp:Transcript_114824/g.357660  ORF Transcript_114824/g.357660 Transcript_114824/m.357660 type:complete len:309 (-) Transcript_114824:596-1522(-)
MLLDRLAGGLDASPRRRHRRSGLAFLVLIDLRFALPSQDHLVLPLRVRLEAARVPSLQDLDVPLLLQALLVAVGASAPAVVVVLDVQRHAVATHDRSVLGDVGASEPVVLLEGHLVVEVHHGVRLGAEEVPQDEVMPGERIAEERARAASEHIDAAELRLGPLDAPHLGNDEARGGDGRDDKPPRFRVCGVHGLVGANLRICAVAVLPGRDVVGDLHAHLLVPAGVRQGLVAGGRELSPDDGLQPQGPVVLQAGVIHVPSRRQPGVPELLLDHEDVAHPLQPRGAAGRHDADVELVLAWEALALPWRE